MTARDRSDKYRYLNIIVFLITAVAGLLFLAISQRYRLSDPEVAHYLQSVSEIILISGLFGIAYEYFLRGEIIRMNDQSSDRVIEYLAISNSVRQLELLDVSRDANRHDFSAFLADSKEVTIVLNDGRTWFSMHMPDLSKRLRVANYSTRILLIHPDSPFVAILAAKVGTDEDGLKDKIIESVKMLTEQCHPGHKLEIYGHSLPTTFSLFMNEHVAKLASYPMAQKTERIPLFVFRNGSPTAYYHSLRSDIEAVFKKHSSPLIPVT